MNKRQLLEEKARRLLLEKYRREPFYWLEQRLGEDRKSFMWSAFGLPYDNHKWDGDKDPLAAAWMALASSWVEIKNGLEPTCRKVGVESATGTGKTYMLARIVLWFLDCWENSLVVTTASKEQQLKLGLWGEISMLMPKLKKFRPQAAYFKLRLAMDNRDLRHLDPEEQLTSDSWHAIGYAAGVGTDEESATRARGFHREHMLIILEECTGISNAVINAFQNTATGQHNLILAVGNPDNEFDPLHRFCIQADTKHIRISALDHPNIVTNTEVFPGSVTTVSLNTRKKTYGEESDLYKAMARGISPAQSADSLIKLEWIEQCINLVDDNLASYNAVGIDVANSEGGDKAAVAAGKSYQLTYLKDFYCPNATHLAYNLVYPWSTLAEHDYKDYDLVKVDELEVSGECIGVDAVGLGVATVNAFKDMGYDVQALQGGMWLEAVPLDNEDKPLYRFESLRAQMYWEAREDLRTKNVSICIEDFSTLERLKKELTLPKFNTNSKTIAIEKKEFIKRRLGGQSPNLMDAFVYWNWVRKGYRISRGGMAALGVG